MALPAEKGNQTWRVIDILNWGEDYFKSKGFESPKKEIEWLLCDLLNYKRIDLYVQFEQPIHRPQLKQLKEWIKRRIGREPLQYITGKTEFYGHKFNITTDVLIPRPETERVVDVALYSIGNIKTPKVLEVGSGSGCIAIAMGAERNDALIESVDVSETAITQAEKNADLNELSNIDFKVMDFLKEIPEGRFDLLVSNPPYIPEKEMSETMPEVHQYEPKIALTDEGDGLTFYRRFAEVGKSLIKPGGWMVLEVGLGTSVKSGGYIPIRRLYPIRINP